MFTLDEIRFYDKYDPINNKVNSVRNEINQKEVVFDTIESVELTYKNRDVVVLKSVLDFKVINGCIYFNNELFSEKLYNNYVNAIEIDNIKIIGTVYDCYEDRNFYYELTINCGVNCRVKNINLNIENMMFMDDIDDENVPCMEVVVS